MIARLAAIAIIAAPCAPTLAQPMIPLNVGVSFSASDAGLFVAEAKGHFKREGLDVNFIAFDSGARMIAPFASGDLDIGGAGPSAALYNAAARNIDIRIVADKGSTPKGRPITYLLVRRDHVESGRYKGFADLKGMKIANSAPGASANTVLAKLLRRAGLGVDDTERVYMGFPQQAVALQNKAVDAALPLEPSASAAVNSGAAARVAGDDEIYPGHQIATIFYTGAFIRDKPEAARKFMRAYIAGVRDYSDALVDGRLAGDKGEEIVAMLARYTQIKDPAVHRAVSPVHVDPDGKLGVESLREDLSIFAAEGLIEGKVNMDKVIDSSFAEAVVKELGPYKQK